MEEEVKLTHILDIEAFYVSRQYLYKEIAIIDCESEEVKRAEFLLHQNFYSLSYKDRRCVSYTFKNVHGILFKNYGTELYYQSEIGYVIEECVKDYENPIVAYKGGCLEKKLLHKLGIDSFNLEWLGCPKFNVLIRDSKFSNISDNCHLHVREYNFKGDRMHCPVAEVEVFCTWYKELIGKE